MKKNIIVIVAVLLLIGYGLFDYYNGNKGLAPAQESAAGDAVIGIQKGEKAPNFELTDVKGNPVQLSDFRGKKVLINFWATWCPPCKAEMPHMQRFYKEFSDEVVVLGVNMTSIDKGMEAIQAFTEEYGLTFPIALDQEGDVMDTYQITAYPTTYAVDQEGIIRAKFIGAIDYEIMKKAVDKM